MELFNSWVRSSNPSTLPFAKTHCCLMATLDLFEISESEQGMEEWNLDGEGKRSGDHFLSLHMWPVCLPLGELAFLSAASAKETELWRPKCRPSSHCPARMSCWGRALTPDEAPRTGFSWHRLVDCCWASCCSTVSVPHFKTHFKTSFDALSVSSEQLAPGCSPYNKEN